MHGAAVTTRALRAIVGWRVHDVAFDRIVRQQRRNRATARTTRSRQGIATKHTLMAMNGLAHSWTETPQPFFRCEGPSDEAQPFVYWLRT